MTPKTLILCLIAAFALSYTGRCEESRTSDETSLFGITVTNTVTEAEKQFDLGHAYHVGDGVEQDTAKAIECYMKAAELGHAQAQFNLALCYMYSNGGEPNNKDAVKWFQKAAEQGIKESYYPLGICYYNLEQYTEAYAWALFAESNGDTRLKEMFEPMFSKEEISAGKIRHEELKKKFAQKKDPKAE